MARYIDADRLKEHIKDLPTWWADYGGVYGQAMKYPEGMFDCEDILGTIDNQLTADVVEVRRGKWIWLEGNLYECSECPSKTEVDEYMNKPLYEYCPYCGAKMSSDDESE